MLTSEEYIEFLRPYADSDDCEGTCDLEPPHKECNECVARRALNDIHEVLRFAYEDINENLNK